MAASTWTIRAVRLSTTLVNVRTFFVSTGGLSKSKLFGVDFAVCGGGSCNSMLLMKLFVLLNIHNLQAFKRFMVVRSNPRYMQPPATKFTTYGNILLKQPETVYFHDFVQNRHSGGEYWPFFLIDSGKWQRLSRKSETS